MTEEVLRILGDVMLHSPSTASRLISKAELSRLLDLTGGSVLLRGRVWTIEWSGRGRMHVRIQLRVE